MNELQRWIAYAPEAERVREALRPSMTDLCRRVAAFERLVAHTNHRHIMRRKVRRLSG